MLQVQSERVHEEAVVNGFFDAFFVYSDRIHVCVIRLSVVSILISSPAAQSPKISFARHPFFDVITFKHDTRAFYFYTQHTQTQINK